jgi:hypothetical protein
LSLLIPFNTFGGSKAIKNLSSKVDKFRHNIISWLRLLAKSMKRQAKYQWLSFSGATLSARNVYNMFNEKSTSIFPLPCAS